MTNISNNNLSYSKRSVAFIKKVIHLRELAIKRKFSKGKIETIERCLAKAKSIYPSLDKDVEVAKFITTYYKELHTIILAPNISDKDELNYLRIESTKILKQHEQSGVNA